jgi:hypothetical protein
MAMARQKEVYIAKSNCSVLINHGLAVVSNSNVGYDGWNARCNGGDTHSDAVCCLAGTKVDVLTV